MSNKSRQLEESLWDISERILLAENDHDAAKNTFSRFEGPCSHPMWQKLRDEVDRSLTHLRVLQATWHRLEADRLDQLNKDKD